MACLYQLYSELFCLVSENSSYSVQTTSFLRKCVPFPDEQPLRPYHLSYDQFHNLCRSVSRLMVAHDNLDYEELL
ncbi:unnamed protein product [Arabis nemorensis]|uniref:Uncharacterized protein n=1 Tax=Arabis nemorensis TaxID=586526 RepID=A0A565B060_9BRAS|nr:unnamed protein product [Arabis nemorensis]